MKVVFKDEERTKVVYGNVEYEEGFVQVTDMTGKKLLINKKNIVFMRDEVE